jgi:hypothetical protein
MAVFSDQSTLPFRPSIRPPFPHVLTTAEQRSHPGVGQYNVALAPELRRPQAFGRYKKDTSAHFTPQGMVKTPGPGAYRLEGDFDRIPEEHKHRFEAAKKDTFGTAHTYTHTHLIWGFDAAPTYPPAVIDPSH